MAFADMVATLECYLGYGEGGAFFRGLSIASKRPRLIGRPPASARRDGQVGDGLAAFLERGD
jgi:hypothetical protein